ncbi:uncharacterized protein EV420DRAFT_1507489 [Desarmillaria tabescens]|uniref:RBR-type E3 ubiquitin transferase n=1 Tax=Armillaria tabescens TaxID=1929756 RepID=A0AA39NKH3_ARMTA|nr:uncharacterized protein EV420DRAFT_1507489 [Desarmillaria tabescens]KAK0467153.1 hypothetical protein EV420DRAFT_1507489 [Desarmillaria tabescens]
MQSLYIDSFHGPTMSRQTSKTVDPNYFFAQIIKDKEKLVVHPGTSQYTIGGVSACGLASLNFARLVLDKEREGIRGAALLADIASVQTVKDIVSICSQWQGNLHLEVETIFAAPLFQTSMKLTKPIYGFPSVDRFEEMLGDLEFASDNTSVAVITRPPEIIACAKVPTPEQNIYVIFDTHPRPTHPDGSGITFLATVENAAQRLSDILSVDSHLLSESGLQWQAQLLANFSAHVFIPNDKWSTDPADLTQALLESSVTILTLKAQLSDLESQNQSLTSTTNRLEEEIDELQETCEQLKKRQSQSQSRFIPPTNVATKWLGAHPGPSQQQKSGKNSKGKGRAQENSTGWEFALNLQREFEEEDHRLEQERRSLAAEEQVLFNCAICLDTFPVDFAAYVAECNHSTCRDCLRQHLLMKLHDHRFPVFCPVCTDGNKKSILSETLVLDIGVPEKEYRIFEELQMSAFSILLHCRQCKKSAFVDRTEYQEAGIIACPLPGCNHTWCKSCQQTIDVTGPQHSCDGSSELDYLMKQRGWKYCPGCKTPVQKESGCNHMTCMSPGCNTHFCYICGGKIVQSALRGDIQAAVSDHYRHRCMLFEVPADV